MRQEKGSEPVQPWTRGQKMEAQAEAEEAEWTRLRGVVTLWLLYNSFYVTLRNKKSTEARQTLSAARRKRIL
jgi:hypothetical protein